jgi:hypothetical protein
MQSLSQLALLLYCQQWFGSWKFSTVTCDPGFSLCVPAADNPANPSSGVTEQLSNFV